MLLFVLGNTDTNEYWQIFTGPHCTVAQPTQQDGPQDLTAMGALTSFTELHCHTAEALLNKHLMLRLAVLTLFQKQRLYAVRARQIGLSSFNCIARASLKMCRHSKQVKLIRMLPTAHVYNMYCLIFLRKTLATRITTMRIPRYHKFAADVVENGRPYIAPPIQPPLPVDVVIVVS